MERISEERKCRSRYKAYTNSTAEIMKPTSAIESEVKATPENTATTKINAE